MRTTVDGYEVTTIEQDGGYAGHEIGRVWLRHPHPQGLAHALQPWTWYHCGTVAHARQAADRVCTMTAAAFERHWETDTGGGTPTERLTWRPQEYTG